MPSVPNTFCAAGNRTRDLCSLPDDATHLTIQPPKVENCTVNFSDIGTARCSRTVSLQPLSVIVVTGPHSSLAIGEVTGRLVACTCTRPKVLQLRLPVTSRDRRSSASTCAALMCADWLARLAQRVIIITHKAIHSLTAVVWWSAYQLLCQVNEQCITNEKVSTNKNNTTN